MATKRKTALDYRRELDDINVQKAALETRIISRARQLCTEHPNIVIIQSCYCKNAFAKEYAKADLDTATALALIEIIERELAEKHPHKQTKMF